MATLAVLRQVTGEDLFDRTRRRGGRHGSALGRADLGRWAERREGPCTKMQARGALQTGAHEGNEQRVGGG